MKFLMPASQFNQINPTRGIIIIIRSFHFEIPHIPVVLIIKIDFPTLYCTFRAKNADAAKALQNPLI